jgi:anti-sigma B factor antagonist
VEETFRISEEASSGDTVLSVAGELDIATAPELRDRLEGAIDRAPQGTVIVDLLEVTFIDSTALGVLIGGLKRSQSTGGVFRIVVAEARILKIFEITGLTDLFSIFDSLSEATTG